MNSASTSGSAPDLVRPGVGGGLAEVFRQRFLLKLLVRKELQIRYRGSALGLLWSYVKPGVQFVVFYIALGVFLGLEKNPRNPDGLANYAIYLFSGIVLINFFSEALGNASRAIVNNGGLIKKIYLPRELFPVASVWVSGVHFVPQLVVLVSACIVAGWKPSMLQLAIAAAGFVIVAMLAIGLGLLFGSANVYFRDSENIVDMLLMVATWASPVMYAWTMVQEKIGHGWYQVYQANPITIGVEAFHYAFWLPTTDGSAGVPPNLIAVWIPVGLVVSLLVLLLGQATFRRLEGRFAQEL